VRTVVAAAAVMTSASAQRHNFDARCPAAVTLDPAGQQRKPNSTSSYMHTVLAANGTVADCARECCNDWSCISFAFFVAEANSRPIDCKEDGPCCVLKDDLDELVGGAPAGVVTGKRGHLAARAPPYSASALKVVVHTELTIGVNGDEFPMTWGADGAQYTGAGDNHQAGAPESPLSFFRVSGGPTELECDHPPTHHDQPSPTCKHITEQGPAVPVRSKAAAQACPAWRGSIPNLKSSGVLSVEGTLYWAISCFNYGDDPTFNRQRYGPAWLMTSRDGGRTWNESATPTHFFEGRLAAPRFVQFGRDYAGARDEHVYLYFPGTSGGAAFFENNDLVLLGRVERHRLLDRAAYEFFTGLQPDGATPTWSVDDSIAVPIFAFPLMTSVQQANWVPALRRYVWANWAWISMDGAPRPDHTPDERNGRTGHQRTQLALLEAEEPWGPFRVLHRDDDWQGADGSSGGYTPVIPPAWVGESDLYLAFTQCCGNPRPPLNHYNLLLQRVEFTA
jgi:hypothetical protein